MYLRSALSIDGRLEPLLYDFAQVVDCRAALFCIAHRGRGEIVCSWGFNESLEIVFSRSGGRLRSTAGRTEGFIGRALADGRLAVEALDPVHDASLARAAATRIGHALAVPVRLPTGAAAALIAGFASPPDFNRTVWRAGCYASMFAVCLEAPEALWTVLAPTAAHAMND